MTKNEKSLLLFLETQAVDHGGALDGRHMNADDFAIAVRWRDEGFLRRFERIPAALLGAYHPRTHIVVLSPEAFVLAHSERLARAALDACRGG